MKMSYFTGAEGLQGGNSRSHHISARRAKIRRERCLHVYKESSLGRGFRCGISGYCVVVMESV